MFTSTTIVTEAKI